ncbi:helix-turn-helix domain-containing protein [Streptomyces sp. BI20]|uniref:helix-turn-helix domain-containing protein n=1 Tax=Streptomyces sp. BI20 TaxID=3403460 RepID=UPI003C7326B6
MGETAPPAVLRPALGGFLAARRGRVSPAEVGIPAGARRRVPGLRREELAQLAGISVDYYVRLEQGRANAPSDEVLTALARALRLDASERRHLETLAGARRAEPPLPHVPEVLRRLLEAADPLPAFVTDHRVELMAWNAAGGELLGRPGEGGRDTNDARFVFLDPAAREVYADWEARAREVVGLLQVAAGRFPRDAELIALIDVLAAGSGEFRDRWASGEVMMCGAGRRRFRHPVAGELALDWQSLRVPTVADATGPALHVFAPVGETDAAWERLTELVRERGGAGGFGGAARGFEARGVAARGS